MSAEPGRKAPYSVDLRWRIVGSILGWILNSERFLTISVCPSVPCTISISSLALLRMLHQSSSHQGLVAEALITLMSSLFSGLF